MPRKPKSDDIRLTRAVSFRLTDADHAAYSAKVEASGLRPSEFFRKCVLKNRTQIVARKKPSVDKRRLIYLVSKAGNNLNQLAHRANTAELAGKITPTTYAAILEELQAITDMMKAVIHNVD